ncbi:Hypothetical predicted protein [Lecanosticta acicola]|uniref:Wax synthase domain-containing protein n=1 Tax=Lecanosticta acicola TaxID=111012 RepID=A0AAI8YRQ5_9PEZI|nr:Hypothetical predicted protein [Lecanosticta acicola]
MELFTPLLRPLESSGRSSRMHHLLATYYELVNTIIPGPQSLSYFVPLALLPGSLLIPPHILSHQALACLSMPIIVGCTVHAWICMRGVDVISADTLWWCFFFLVFRDPRKDFRRLRENGKNEGYPHRFWPRVKWVGTLLTERPLTCWKTGEPSHDAKVSPPYIQQSRLRFIASILSVLVPSLAIFMPLALQLKRHDTFFATAENSLRASFPPPTSSQPQTIRILQRLVPPFILRPATQGLYTYSLMTTLFLPPFLLPVLMTYLTDSPRAHWSPHTWPRPHFGPIASVFDTGLRGLWGTWWHQQMRHAVSEPGRFLARKSGLKKGGFGRYALICASAFFLSGITHAGLVVPEPRWAASRHGACWELRLLFAGFFWVQAVGILLEVKIVEPVVRLLGRRSEVMGRTLRVCWVLAFMGFAFTFLFDPFIEVNIWGLWPPPMIPEGIGSVLRGDWIP